VAIMYLGKVTEAAASETIYRQAEHPYTQSLIAAIPVWPLPINGSKTTSSANV